RGHGMAFKDPEKKRAYNSNYRKTHPAQCAAASARYRERHPDRVLAARLKAGTKSYWSNPERARETARRGFQKNRAKRLAKARLVRLTESPEDREKRLAKKRAAAARAHPNKWLARFIAALKDPKKAAQLAKRRIYEARR